MFNSSCLYSHFFVDYNYFFVNIPSDRQQPQQGQQAKRGVPWCDPKQWATAISIPLLANKHRTLAVSIRTYNLECLPEFGLELTEGNREMWVSNEVETVRYFTKFTKLFYICIYKCNSLGSSNLVPTVSSVPVSGANSFGFDGSKIPDDKHQRSASPCVHRQDLLFRKYKRCK